MVVGWYEDGFVVVIGFCMKFVEKGVWVGCDVSGCVDFVEGSGDFNSGICGGIGLWGILVGMDWVGKVLLEFFWFGDVCIVGGMLWIICCWFFLDGFGFWEDMGIFCMIFFWEWCWRVCGFCVCRVLVFFIFVLCIVVIFLRVWVLLVGLRFFCVCFLIMCCWLVIVWRFCCCKVGVVNCFIFLEKNY